MSLSSNFVLNDNAAAAKTFAAVSVSGTETIRMDTSTTSTEPRKMIIRHASSVDKTTKVPVDRHLLSFSDVSVDAEGLSYTQTGNFTLWVPRSAAVTRADTDHLIAFCRNFLAVTGNVDSFLRGES